MTHTALSALNSAEQREELVASKLTLEKWLGRTIYVYAYPYGDRAVYTRKSVRLCAEVGFQKAAAVPVEPLAQAHRWTDPYQLPRHMVLDWPVEVFARKISEFGINSNGTCLHTAL